jgi:hypothetical protein
MGRQRGRWDRTCEEIYVYRTDKPSAVLGLPVIGRHFAYGGRTNDPKARHAEHMTGRSRRTLVGRQQPWSDLRPRRYVVFRRKYRTEWMTDLLERVVIKGLLCVYNHMDRASWNPRYVSPRQAAAQRRTRDSLGKRKAAGLRLVLRWAIYLSILSVICYLLSR